MTGRIIGSVMVFVSILVLPSWVYLPLLLIAILAFPFFWEGILFGFLIDVIYGRGIELIPSLISPFALLALVILIVIMPIKENLRSNA
ncbi:MAG: hypothetical protein WAX80_02565 [Minisyncoccia bacterium]